MAIGLALVLIVVSVIAWLLFFRRGSLQVTKEVYSAGAVDVSDFTFCIQGPSYPEMRDCKVFNEMEGWTQT